MSSETRKKKGGGESWKREESVCMCRMTNVKKKKKVSMSLNER